VRVAGAEGTYIARRWPTVCVLQRVMVRCIYCKTIKIVLWLIVLSEMKGRVERVRNTMLCQYLHKMEVKRSALPQACLALGSTHRHTLDKRMTGCQIHTGLLYLEFLSVCNSVLYEVYIVIVCII
jgi:hypothetical protein